MNKKHIIIINPDEMRADTMSHLEKRGACTPCLDEFVQKDAVSFSNAFCQNPVCVPSRCSFFTGLYPHVFGHRTMSHLLQSHEKSLFELLRKNGYYVWMNNRNDLYAGQYPGWSEQHADEIYYGEDIKPAPLPKNKNIRGERGSKFYYSHFGGELEVDEDGKNYTYDDACIDAAIEKILNYKEGDQPLCIFLGLLYPHVPYQIEEPYLSRIDRDQLKPRIKLEDCHNKSKMLNLYHQYQNLEELNEEEWKDIRQTYLAMVNKVDEQFGRLMDALKKANLYDDSAVFFFSDHGDFAGDYGMVEKAQSSFEDCLVHVPFLLKPPKGYEVTPGISSAMVELVDFYATVLDIANIRPEQSHFGQSLLPLLKDPACKNREFVCCEGGRLPQETWCDEYHKADGSLPDPSDLYYPKRLAQSDNDAHAKATMIRTLDYKYISRISNEDELYDLRKDPNETNNIIDDPDYNTIKTDLQIKLLKWLQTTSDIVPMKQDSRFSDYSLLLRMKGMMSSDQFAVLKEMVKSGTPLSEIKKQQKR